MRHQNHKYRFGKDATHRGMILQNLAIEVIDHGKIKTTHTKCLALKPVIEKLITLAKVDSVANRRLAYSKLNNKDAVAKLFKDVAPKFKTRPGGYTRVLKLAESRLGDNAPMSYIALVD